MASILKLSPTATCVVFTIHAYAVNPNIFRACLENADQTRMRPDFTSLLSMKREGTQLVQRLSESTAYRLWWKIWSTIAFSLDIGSETIITASIIYYLVKRKTSFPKCVSTYPCS